MKDAIHSGDGVLISKVHYGSQLFNHYILKFSTIKRNDVVVFKRSGQKMKTFIKRCIGLPGDTLLVQNNVVFIKKSGLKHTFNKTCMPEIKVLIYKNNERLPHFYKSETRADFGPLVVPKKGGKVVIDSFNIVLYKDVIEKYEHNKVSVLKGKVFINGIHVNIYSFKRNYYFMLGDNRNYSVDSRYWGFVQEKEIIGKAFLKVFSFDLKKGVSSINFNSFKQIN